MSDAFGSSSLSNSLDAINRDVLRELAVRATQEEREGYESEGYDEMIDEFVDYFLADLIPHPEEIIETITLDDIRLARLFFDEKTAVTVRDGTLSAFGEELLLKRLHTIKELAILPGDDIKEGAKHRRPIDEFLASDERDGVLVSLEKLTVSGIKLASTCPRLRELQLRGTHFDDVKAFLKNTRELSDLVLHEDAAEEKLCKIQNTLSSARVPLLPSVYSRSEPDDLPGRIDVVKTLTSTTTIKIKRFSWRGWVTNAERLRLAFELLENGMSFSIIDIGGSTVKLSARDGEALDAILKSWKALLMTERFLKLKCVVLPVIVCEGESIPSWRKMTIDTLRDASEKCGVRFSAVT